MNGVIGKGVSRKISSPVRRKKLLSICALRFGIGKEVSYSLPHFLMLRLLVMGCGRWTKVPLHELEGLDRKYRKVTVDLAIEALRKGAEEEQIRAEERHERERGEKEEVKRGGSSARYRGEVEVGGY